MRRTKIDLTLSSEDDTLIASWEINDKYRFSVRTPMADFIAANQDIRDELNELDEHIHKVTCKFEIVKERDRDFSKYNRIINSLRLSGFHLYNRLTGDKDKLRALLESREDEIVLSIYYSSYQIMCPIGFVCCSEADVISPVPSKADFSDFWVSRFCISNYIGTTGLDIDDDDSCFHAEKFRGLFAIGNQEWKDSSAGLHADFVDCLGVFDLEFGVANTWKQLEEKWRKMGAFDGVLFLLGKADGVSIELDYSKERGSDIVRRIRAQKITEANRLLFLNGCLTAVGSTNRATTLLSLADTGHFKIIVGTEGEVTNYKALMCGAFLIRLLCEGRKTLGEAMQDMRNNDKLFPTNYYYTLYGLNEFKLDRPLSQFAAQ